VGVDESERLIEEARTLADKLKTSNAAFRVGEADDLPFPDETFDLVYSTWVCGWVCDPVQALKEQKRVTKPGGWGWWRPWETLGLWSSIPPVRRSRPGGRRSLA
jgi:ubiquinone/menaquinone biosynthesis C-methylase UbiE